MVYLVTFQFRVANQKQHTRGGWSTGKARGMNSKRVKFFVDISDYIRRAY